MFGCNAGPLAGNVFFVVCAHYSYIVWLASNDRICLYFVLHPIIMNENHVVFLYACGPNRGQFAGI